MMRAATIRERFVRNFRDPHVRANVLAMAGGKVIGLTLLLTAMGVFLPPALPQAPSGCQKRASASA